MPENTARTLAAAVATSGPDTTLVLAGLLAGIALLISMLTRRLPLSEVVLFLAIGVVLGPSGVSVLNDGRLSSLQPVVALALGAMVFVIGERLALSALRPTARLVVPMAVLGSLGTAVVTFAGLRLVGLDNGVAFLLATMAPSTAPVTVRALIAERRAAGPFTDALLGATAINNLVTALLFGLGAPFVLTGQAGAGAGEAVSALLQLIGVAVGLAAAAAGLLVIGNRYVAGNGQRFLLVWVVVLVQVGVAQLAGSSVVVTTLLSGAAVANAPGVAGALFDQVRVLEAPIFLVFFVATGAGVRLSELAAIGVAGVAYIAARAVGRTLGAWLGLQLSAAGRATGWGYRAGVGQLPYAGMAVGLASFTVERSAELGIADTGQQVAALVLSAVLVFDLVTPLLLDRALHTVGEAGQEPTLSGDTASRRGERPVGHVLVPLATSAAASALIPVALDIASWGGSRLTVLVVRSGVPGAEPSKPLGVVHELADAAGVPVCVERATDCEPVDAIVEQVRRDGVDLVVTRPGAMADQVTDALRGTAQVLLLGGAPRPADAGDRRAMGGTDEAPERTAGRRQARTREKVQPQPDAPPAR